MSNFRIALPQVIAVTIKNMLFIEFGMALGFPTILIPSVSGKDPTEKLHLDNEAISWIGSINFICFSVGSIAAGPVSQLIGRKRLMQVVTLPFFASWLIFYFSSSTWEILFALCITGFSGGILEAPVVSYVAEICQPHLRGMLSSTGSMSVAIGSLFQFLLGTFLPWRQVALVNTFVPLISLLLITFIPESPFWLLQKNREKEARKSLAWLRGWSSEENIQEEFLELSLKIKESSPIDLDKPDTILDRFKFLGKREFYWPLCLISFTFFLSHFNGTKTFVTYSILIFGILKSPINEYYATVLIGTIEVLGCAVSISIVNILGRRKLNFISVIGSALCYMFIAVYIYVEGILYLNQDYSVENDTKFWAPASALILATFIFSIGLRLLPWVTMAEVFPNEYRATAAGLCCAIGYVQGFVPNKIFFTLTSSITLPGVFLFYSILGCLGVCVLYFVLPETEGKPLADITNHFRGVEKLGNDVTRRKANQSETAI